MSGPYAHTRWGLVPAADAGLDATDAGLRGDGVFTTVLVRGSVALWLDEHVTRLVRDAAALGIAAPEPTWFTRTVAVVTAANDGELDTVDTALRITVTRGAASPDAAFGAPVGPPSVLVTQHALAPAPAVVRAVTVGWSRTLAHVKHTSWLAASEALRRARAGGADTAVLTRPDPGGDHARDLLLEGATANLVLVDAAGRLCTPPDDGAVLPGVTRAAVLDLARREGREVVERPVTRADLHAATEALLTSSLRGVVALSHLDDVPVGGTGGTEAPGPVTRTLRDAWAGEAARRAAAGA
ncbi:MAG: aminotransferase class IV [Actinomycetes bacterium]